MSCIRWKLLSPIAFCLALLALPVCHAQSIALTGTVLGPAGPVEHETVWVRDGTIVAVGAQIALPADVRRVDLGDAILAPGFIDLHNHMSYNVFPRWKPSTEFGSRYDWQQKPVYNVLITVPHQELVEHGLVCDAERYAELKALAQGETSTVGSDPTCGSVNLTRKLDVDSGLPGAPTILYNVFPFQMTPAQRAAADKVLSATPHGSLLIHVSEGAPHNASTAREFTMLRQQGFLRPGVNVIHGVAISAEGFAEMAHAGVGWIWSPRSNIELYGDTADVAAAHAAGVEMALAPDWSPTGSVGTLSELQYASLWNRTQAPPPLTDRELVSMVTENPATMVGLDAYLGAIVPGHAADLVVLRRTEPDVYAAMTHAAPQDVMLTVVRGQAVFGDPSLLQRWGVAAIDSVSVCGATRAFASTMRYSSTLNKLAPALQRMGRTLAPLAECGQ